MTTYNIKHKRGDTYHAREFQVSAATGFSTLSAFPVTGMAGVIYVALDTGIHYEWLLTVYAVTTNRTYKDLTGVAILCQLRLKADLPVIYTVATSLTDPTDGKFRFDEQDIDIPGKPYMYDVQFTYPSGYIETYIGGVWTIEDDISRYT